jgi:periplasmic divalent cation tolerance protein
MATHVVLVTAPDPATARELATTLLRERLVACANLVSGVTSLYRWEGRVEEDEEVLLVLKTGADRVGELEERVPALHPYEVPEVVVLPVEGGHAPYLDWVESETRRVSTPSPGRKEGP